MTSKQTLAIAIIFAGLCCSTLYRVVRYHDTDNAIANEKQEHKNATLPSLNVLKGKNQTVDVAATLSLPRRLDADKYWTTENNFSKVATQLPNSKIKQTRVKICICALTRSKPKWKTLDDSRVMKNVIASTHRTTAMEWGQFELQILFGADTDDAFWQRHADALKQKALDQYEMQVTLKFYKKQTNFLPFNSLMRDGYHTGSEYLVRINDDTEFTSKGWVSLGVRTLQSFQPPNVGVVGPTCAQGNTKILTHDMVHRTHLEIFETYYPAVFHNWYLDDWISLVYGALRTKKIKKWTVFHHVEEQGQRYTAMQSDSELLRGEIAAGEKLIDEYLTSKEIVSQSPRIFAVPQKKPDIKSLESQEGNDWILNRMKENNLFVAGQKNLETDDPFIVGRLGAAEACLLAQYLSNSAKINPCSDPHQSSGIYPESSENFELFARTYFRALQSLTYSDAMASFPNIRQYEEIIFPKLEVHTIMKNRALEPFYFDNPWSMRLFNKTVLVVHPFVSSIKCQLSSPFRDKIFENEKILPKFSVKFVQMPQCLGKKTPHKSWSDTLQHVKNEIDSVGQFDIAIIAAGSYGMPLAVHCKQKHHKSAIVMGGGSQVFFGLKGRRWDTHAIISKLYNKHWIYPLEKDTPDNAEIIEHGGPYWGPKSQRLAFCKFDDYQEGRSNSKNSRASGDRFMSSERVKQGVHSAKFPKQKCELKTVLAASDILITNSNHDIECSDMGWPWSGSVAKRDPQWMVTRLDPKKIGSMHGKVVIEIGANTGRDSSVYLKMGAKSMHLFEPLPDVANALQKRFSSHDNVFVYNYALGETNRHAFLKYAGEGGEATSEMKTGNEKDRVQVRDVIHVFQNLIGDDHRVFLAINCEGCEYKVLERLATYNNGAYLRNGSIEFINMAKHSQKTTTERVAFCESLSILQDPLLWQQTYCSGPWMGWQKMQQSTNEQDKKTSKLITDGLVKTKKINDDFFMFSVVVLTKNRPVDLRRLLESIQNTNFNGQKIRLVIKIDNAIDNQNVIDIAKQFTFSHGSKTVHVSPYKLGLKNAWLNAWIPETEHERAIILEDDIELSPAWFTWLTDAWKTYESYDSVMGISLCRETRIMKVAAGKSHEGNEIVNNHTPYLYKFVGTWGYSPHPVKWKRFLQWVEQNNDKPHEFFNVPGILPTEWWKTFIQSKRTDSMWTQLMHYYVDRVQPNLYHMYVNLPGKETIAAHHRSKGEHYSGGQGIDFKLAASVKHDFPIVLNKYGWDGQLVSSLQQDSILGSNAQKTGPVNKFIDMAKFINSFSGGGMSKEETEFLAQKYARATHGGVFEWGMGSSTLLSHFLNVRRLAAVDSDRKWVESLKKKLKDNNTYDLIFVDVGPVKEFGTPIDRSHKSNWPGYCKIVDTYKEPFDIYLVDGRFRVACACRAFLHAHSDSEVIVHDFSRPEYNVLLQISDKMSHIKNNIVSLKRRKDIPDDTIVKLWEKSQFLTL